jgi:TRAP-type C4-dicarboxylate transport system permease small subunit
LLEPPYISLTYMAINFLKHFSKLQSVIRRGEKAFCISAMAFIIALNIYGIGRRYIFNSPVIYVQELTILGGVWLTFIGIGLFFKDRSDISIDILVQHLPKRLKLLNELFVDLVLLFFVAVTAWECWKFIPFTRTASHVLSFALGLPEEVFYYPMGLGAISIAFTFLHHFIRHLDQLCLKGKVGTFDEKAGD